MADNETPASRKRGGSVVLTVLTSLAAGRILGAGVGISLLSPAIGVGLAVMVGIAVGLRVKRLRQTRRMSSPNKSSWPDSGMR